MRDSVPSCFGGSGAAAGAPPSSTACGPNLTTSLYETRLCLAALSWSRSAFGLSLRLHLFFSDHRHVSFNVRPWLLWKRRGQKRFTLDQDNNNETLLISWDLSAARFPSSGGPEPSKNFFVAIVLSGDMLLPAGDLPDLAFRRTNARPTNTSYPRLISRREHVVFKGEAKKYETTVEVGGRERKVAIDVSGAAALTVALDGERVLHVKRIKWKFRGSEIVDAAGGHVRISWDLHDWLFPMKKDVKPPPPSPQRAADHGCAVFMLHFDEGKHLETKNSQGHSGKDNIEVKEKAKNRKLGWWYFGKSMSWGENNKDGEGEKRKVKNKSLLKTSSSSSSASTASSTSSSTVTDWNSAEEAQLESDHGFSLLVHAWKS